MANVVMEKSSAYLSVSFRDKAGAESNPASASWKAHDKASGRELQAETALPSGATVEITLPPSINTLVDTSKSFEIRVITVEALFGANDGVNQQFEYTVTNLAFV